MIDALVVPVRIASGMLTDELVGLAGRGLQLGTAEAAYLRGGAELRALAGAGRVRLRSAAETHHPGRLAVTEGLVTLNTALQVGLDGAVNVEQVGERVIAGPGGHSDYGEAAARAPGGASIIVLRASRGERSNTLR